MGEMGDPPLLAPSGVKEAGSLKWPGLTMKLVLQMEREGKLKGEYLLQAAVP